MKNLLLSAIALGVLSIVGCDKDDDHDHDHNDITINILEPMQDEVITDASNVTIHIMFEGTEDLEEIEIVLYAHENEEMKIIDFDNHTHAKTYEFLEEVDLSSYPAGTEFHLEIDVCEDHDCTEKVHKHLDFNLQ